MKNAKKKYSYTLYDYLGRIEESGELETSHYSQFDIGFTLDFVNYSNYISLMNATKSIASYRFVTRTYYDKVKFASLNSNFSAGMQENLRNRIASITLGTLDTDKGAAPSTYHTALHYSYDILGNVHALVSENKQIGLVNQQFKQLEYDYDLVSGKVNKVVYQREKPDQFMYRYRYDAENRITTAESSRDNLYWDRDDSYDYYLHGP